MKKVDFERCGGPVRLMINEKEWKEISVTKPGFEPAISCTEGKPFDACATAQGTNSMS